MSDLAATILATSIAFSAFFVGYVRLLRDAAKEMKDLSVEIEIAAESAQRELDLMARNAARRRRVAAHDLTPNVPESDQVLVSRGGDVLKG